MLTQFKRAALVSGAVLLPVTSAHAQFLTGGDISGCGGNNFIACATWSALASSNGDTLTFTITNNSNLAPASNSSAFTEIAIGNGPTVDPTHFSFTGSGSWHLDTTITGFNGFGLVQNAFGGDNAAGNPAVTGLATGQTVTFKFWWDNPVNTSDFDNAQVAVHSQAGPNKCSTKAVWDANTGKNIGDSTVTADCGGSSTVPEPSSVTLLGSALVGLAGTGFVRRRR